MIIIGSDSEIMFFPSFHFKKALQSSPLKCVLYTGFAKGGLFVCEVGVRRICGCDLYQSIYGSYV